ncbi:nucleotide exchange factor GrpE [bacterium]|nr:nucleotide exchange factor GrpE [bacterium]
MSSPKENPDKKKKIPLTDEPENTPERDYEAEYKALEDKYLRLAADFENYKKRQQKFTGDILNSMQDAMLARFLEIKDNLERALKAAEESECYESFYKGIELTYKHYCEMLRQEGVEELECMGMPFDPLVHEAVSQMPAEPDKDGMVIEEIQKGYRRKDRLIRPSRVVVGISKDDDKESAN